MEGSANHDFNGIDVNTPSYAFAARPSTAQRELRPEVGQDARRREACSQALWSFSAAVSVLVARLAPTDPGRQDLKVQEAARLLGGA